jgi:hypothetical protein
MMRMACGLDDGVADDATGDAGGLEDAGVVRAR